MYRVMLEDASKPENLNPIVDSGMDIVSILLDVPKRLVLMPGMRWLIQASLRVLLEVSK